MIYFLLAVFLGPFYLLNLVLAVVSASYEQEVNGDPDLVSIFVIVNIFKNDQEKKKNDEVSTLALKLLGCTWLLVM